MNTCKLAILGGALIVVVAIILVSERLGTSRPGGRNNAFFPGFSADNCSAFLIVEKKDSVRIRKKGDIWVVAAQATRTRPVAPALGDDQAATDVALPASGEEYPADSASVFAALEKLAAMRKDELISQNTAKQEVFEVDSAHGTLVEVWNNAGKSLGRFRIGKNGPDWSSHFVRVVGSNDVYTVRGSIKYSFFSDRTRWRNKTILRFDKTLAGKITLVHNERGTIELEKTMDSASVETWRITAPEELKTNKRKVENLVGKLADLRTTGWEEDTSLADSTMGFDSPELIATVLLENGEEETVVVGRKKEDKAEYWVRARGNNTVFIVSKYNIDVFNVPMADLAERKDTGGD